MREEKRNFGFEQSVYWVKSLDGHEILFHDRLAAQLIEMESRKNEKEKSV